MGDTPAPHSSVQIATLSSGEEVVFPLHWSGELDGIFNPTGVETWDSKSESFKEFSAAGV